MHDEIEASEVDSGATSSAHEAPSAAFQVSAMGETEAIDAPLFAAHAQDTASSAEHEPLTAEVPPSAGTLPPPPPPPTAVPQRHPTPAPSGGTGKVVGIAAVVAALVGAGVGAGVATAVSHHDSSTSSGATIIHEADSSSPGAVLPNGATIPALVQTVLPSIVSIDSTGGGSEDQGTGMILSSTGLVLTNNHVIANAVSGGVITVTLSGTTKVLPALLVGHDPSNDMALLRIEGASGLRPITFGRSNGAVVGTAVVAIGNALGLAAGTPTVTSGIVSALGRTVTASDGSGTSTETLTNMIQTDAAINPGNSGGPLLNARGQVIGMNTAVAGSASDGSSAQNIGFAIPSAHLEAIIPALLKGSTVHSHAYLGVEVESVNAELQNEYSLTPSSGAFVAQVVPLSPAANAGLQVGDVIVAINGTTITSDDQLVQLIGHAKPGESITLKIYRGSQTKTLTATLGARS